jgi:putative Holliday junction resolvase
MKHAETTPSFVWRQGVTLAEPLTCQKAARVAYNATKMATVARSNTREIPAGKAVHGGRSRILAIDYGRKRIGLALSDDLGLTAQPHATLERRNRRDDLRRLRDVCREYRVGHILVGYPLHITGETGPMAQEAARFAARVEKELGIQTELMDERLSSWEARRIIAETKPAPRRKGVAVDDVAAAVLLRDYLEQRREKHAGRS